MTDLAADLSIALKIADLADAISMSHYRSIGLKVETKPDLTPVTEADQAVEAAIRELLAESRPADLIVGEEFGGDAALASGRRWIVDPIDGTKNYLRGVPVWATLIALAEGDEILCGVVSAPAMNRRWWGGATIGAFTRDADGTERAIEVSNVDELSNASFSYSDAVGWDRYGEAGPKMLEQLIEKSWRTRGYGDFLSHVLVSEGAVDIAAEPILEPWDVAAIIAVVEGAGGKLTGFYGDFAVRSRAGLSTNGHLHSTVLNLLH
jgi:histidinol-phosphatase